MHPKVSILVPVYGIEKYVGKCAASIFAQTYDNLEIIFVNDCTKDNSVEVINNSLKDFPDRKCQTRIVHHDVNKGLAATRNTGLDNASGEYFMLVDGDDWLASNAVEECVENIDDGRIDVLVFGATAVYKNYNKKFPKYLFENKEEYIQDIIARNCTVNVWGKLYKRSIFVNSEARFIPGLNNGEDYVTLPRIIYYASNIKFIDSVLYFYNKQNENSFGNSYKPEYADNVLRAIVVLRNFFEEKDAGIYRSALNRAESAVKSGIVQRAFTNKGLSSKREEYCSLFSSTDIPCNMSLYDKVIFYLSRKRLYLLLSLICKSRRFVSYLIKGN